MKKNIKYRKIHDLNIESIKTTSRNKAEKEIKNDFSLIDRDNSGYIDLDELQEGLKKYGIKLSVKNTKKVFKKYDDNPDNKIDIYEFVQLKRDIDTDDFKKTQKRRQKSKLVKKIKKGKKGRKTIKAKNVKKANNSKKVKRI